MAKLEKRFLFVFGICLFLTFFVFRVLEIPFFDKHNLGSLNEKLNLAAVSSPSPTLISILPTVSPTPTPVEVRLIVAGDVMLARSVGVKMRQLGDFTYPFAKVASFLKEADLTLVNLESPLGTNCPITDEGMVFCADSRAIGGLVKSGVDLVSLANNHALDQGENGLEQTIQVLQSNLITPMGLKEPIFLQVNGVKLGFLAYNAVYPQSESVSWADPEVVELEVEQASREADVLIVFFHWGDEYTKKPQAGGACPYDPRQLGHLAVEAGADLVLGAHPHVVQENEWYQEKLIIYSLGNFVFDQEWSKATQKGMIADLVLDKNGLVSSRFHEVDIVAYQPKIRNSP